MTDYPLSPACAACREPSGTCFPGPCKLYQARRAGKSPIRIKPGESLQDALNARTPKDYAIEFAEYMAKSAERFLALSNEMDKERDIHGMASLDTAIAHHEAWRGLQSDIYEFRKRRDRI